MAKRKKSHKKVHHKTYRKRSVNGIAFVLGVIIMILLGVLYVTFATSMSLNASSYPQNIIQLDDNSSS